METKINTLGLLHDTCLKEIKPIDNGFQFFFAFYLNDDKEYKVELICNNITNISCTVHSRDNKIDTIDLVDFHEVDCIKVKKNEHFSYGFSKINLHFADVF